MPPLVISRRMKIRPLSPRAGVDCRMVWKYSDEGYGRALNAGRENDDKKENEKI